MTRWPTARPILFRLERHSRPGVPRVDMHLRWKLFANLAETAGTREVEVAVEEETVGGALDALFETHPELRAEVLDDDGDLYDHVRLLRNADDPFVRADGLATPVDPDDELALFPPVSGG